MIHLLNICDWIGAVLPDAPDKIQAWAAILTLIVTLLTYLVAIKALNIWKEEKEYDVLQDGYANAYNAMYIIFEFIRMHGDINVLDERKQKFHQNLRDDHPEINKIHLVISTREYYFQNKYKDSIEETYKIATKVIRALDNKRNDPLYIFYNSYIFHYTKTRLNIDQLLRYRHSQSAIENGKTPYFLGFTPDNPIYKNLMEYYTQEKINSIGNETCEQLDKINEVIQISFNVSSSKRKS